MMLMSNSGSQGPQEVANHSARPPSPRFRRKRRNSNEGNNERLSKRLGLLNLDNSGNRIYLPVETPQPTSNTKAPLISPRLEPQDGSAIPDMDIDTPHPASYRTRSSTMYSSDSAASVGEDSISVTSSSDGDSDTEGRVIIHPSLRRHLRQQQRKPLVPRHILPNKEGELAGMQMVLYSEPSALTVPESQDSVRRAVVEARQRLRAKQAGQEEHEMGEDGDIPSRRELDTRSWATQVSPAIQRDADGDYEMDID